MSKITPNIKTLFKTLSTVLDEWGCVNDSEHEAAQAARKLKQALILQYPPKAWKTEDACETVTKPLPSDFIETVKRHALVHLVDANQDPLEMTLRVLDSYSKQSISQFEKNGEVFKVLNKIERVIPLLLRAMETTDDSDLLEASVDLLEVHLFRLSELTK